MEQNTRPLRAAGSAFHLGGVAKGQGKTLCDYCDRRGNDCEKPPMQEGCADLVPALFFIPPHIGLDGVFSTFRASALWYDRARALWKTHRTVALIDSTDMSRVGRATVLGAYRGPFWALMEEHAHSNHLMRDRGLSKPDAAAELTKWIARHMGSRYAKDREGICSVIYLKRL
jgi:hypothetical protein